MVRGIHLLAMPRSRREGFSQTEDGGRVGLRAVGKEGKFTR
jgi:hypothetical protein